MELRLVDSLLEGLLEEMLAMKKLQASVSTCSSINTLFISLSSAAVNLALEMNLRSFICESQVGFSAFRYWLSPRLLITWYFYPYFIPD